MGNSLSLLSLFVLGFRVVAGWLVGPAEMGLLGLRFKASKRR
jgi:hypothetical protein